MEILEPIPEYCEHMRFEDFVSAVKEGCFIDYDGTGYYANDSQMSRTEIKPSDIMKGKIIQGWTYVVWFNK